MGVYRKRVQDLLWIEASVSLTTEEAKARMYPPDPLAVRLIIDTAADLSVITPRVRSYLRLLPRRDREATITIPGEPGKPLKEKKVPYYLVRLDFPPGTLRPELALVVELTLPQRQRGYDGLIGRNVLRRWWETRYAGTDGWLTIRDERSPWAWLGRKLFG